LAQQLRDWRDAAKRPQRAGVLKHFCAVFSMPADRNGVIMDIALNTIAVVRGSSGAEVQDVLLAFVDRWRRSARLAGLIAQSHGLPDRACSAGYLRSIATGEQFSIFQDLGPGSTACHLDGSGALQAAAAVRSDIAAGCDLVVLSKFGKLETGGGGLFPAFKAAMDAQVALLTSVSPAGERAWKTLSGGSFTVLPADLEKISAWWQAIRQNPARAVAAAS
jgi:Protein of unknown function (DUF2478)